MEFRDDEPPTPISSSSSTGTDNNLLWSSSSCIAHEKMNRSSVVMQAGTKPRQGERVRLVAYHNDEAPLVKHRQQVLLEVKDTSRSAAERSGLDLVAVLDVSGSMHDDMKLDRMKTAMKFVISKLGSMDRLSIVSFSDEAKKWCSLQCMAMANKKKLIKDVIEDGLKAGGWTNMEDGLVTGLKVLADRQHFAGRVGSIILMSDGEQNRGGKAQDVEDIPNAAVYTFGFGAESDAKALVFCSINCCLMSDLMGWV
jgi:Mg-chelatase subunit ChlD